MERHSTFSYILLFANFISNCLIILFTATNEKRLFYSMFEPWPSNFLRQEPYSHANMASYKLTLYCLNSFFFVVFRYIHSLYMIYYFRLPTHSRDDHRKKILWSLLILGSKFWQFVHALLCALGTKGLRSSEPQYTETNTIWYCRLKTEYTVQMWILLTYNTQGKL